MKVRVKRIDKSFPLPVYETPGSVGFDLICREEVTVKPKSISLLPTNIIVETPEEYMLMLAPRSSTFKKKGLLMPNSVGIIDQDYCGDTDEVLLQVYNSKSEPVIVRKGEKLGQGIFVRVDRVKWEEIEGDMGESRGGFGSTDSN